MCDSWPGARGCALNLWGRCAPPDAYLGEAFSGAAAFRAGLRAGPRPRLRAGPAAGLAALGAGPYDNHWYEAGGVTCPCDLQLGHPIRCRAIDDGRGIQSECLVTSVPGNPVPCRIHAFDDGRRARGYLLDGYCVANRDPAW